MSDARPQPRSEAELEAAIRERRQHLTQTLDELSRRLEPRRLGREMAQDARDEARTLVVDPVTGRWRTERIGAVLAAIVVLMVVSLVARSRRRRADRG